MTRRIGVCVRMPVYTYHTAAKWLLAIAIHARAYRHVASVLLHFCTWISLQPPRWSWTWLYHKKATLTQNSTIYSTWEILSTFHTQVDNRSIRHFCIVFTLKMPLPLRRSPPKSNTPIPSPTQLTTPNGIPILSPVLPLLTCEDRQMVGTNVPYQ